MGAVVVCGNCKLVEFRILREGAMAKRTIITLVSRRAEFGCSYSCITNLYGIQF